MNTVDPLKSLSEVRRIAEFLKRKNYRDYAWFFFGIHIGLRITDLMGLKVRDVVMPKPSGRVFLRKSLRLRERKTGKERAIALSDPVRELLREYLSPLGEQDPERPLFVSRKSGEGGSLRPLSRSQAWRVLNSAAREIGLEIPVGTHTLRKTFGYHVYQQTKDVASLQVLLGHDSQETTLRYIGVRQVEKDLIYRTINYKGLH